MARPIDETAKNGDDWLVWADDERWHLARWTGEDWFDGDVVLEAMGLEILAYHGLPPRPEFLP